MDIHDIYHFPNFLSMKNWCLLGKLRGPLKTAGRTLKKLRDCVDVYDNKLKDGKTKQVRLPRLVVRALG